MKIFQARQNLSSDLRSCLRWHGFFVFVYTLYILEFCTYFAMESMPLANEENESFMRGPLPFLIVLNVILLVAARTIQAASLSLTSWLAFPVLIYFTLIGLIFIALDVNADLIFFLSFIAFILLPQIHFLALRRRIHYGLRPVRKGSIMPAE